MAWNSNPSYRPLSQAILRSSGQAGSAISAPLSDLQLSAPILHKHAYLSTRNRLFVRLSFCGDSRPAIHSCK